MLTLFVAVVVEQGDYSTEETHSTPIHAYTAITVAQAVLVIKAFSVRHCLSQTAVGDLLSLLSILLPIPSNLPTSYHLFSKLFSDPSEAVSIHYYCKNVDCMSPVAATDTACSECETFFSAAENQKLGLFFLTLDLQSQICQLLENDGVGSKLSSGYKSDTNDVKYVGDGTFLKSIPELHSSDTNVCLTWNCDGVPLFKSSEYSVWPIRCIISNLPYAVAIKNMLVAALWFGKGKPCMSTYLEQFVSNVTDLNKSGGVKWMHPVTKQLIHTSVFPVICSSDAAARCMLQGIQQYNGQYGCSWCLDIGQVVPKGRGFTRVYVSDTPQLPRTHDLVIKHGNEVIHSNSKHVMGVKTLSPLALLGRFDMVASFVVDYMHCVLLGCVRQFLDMWLNSKYHDMPWYVGTKITVLDAKLLKLKPPCDVKRTPRSLKRAQTWKASECYNWLLYYSVSVLSGVLPGNFLKHWLLLIDGVFYLLRVCLTDVGIEGANRKLSKFVEITATLYGKEHVVYNVHQLTHLAESVMRCGPLWATSAFPFEGHNQNLLKLFSGTNYIMSQIAHSFVTLASLPSLLKQTMSADPDCQRVSGMVRQWLHGYLLTCHAVHVEEVVAFGVPVMRQLTAVELSILQPVLDTRLSDSEQFYNRVSIRGKIFCTESYCARLKTNSYTVEMDNHSFGEIVNFVLLQAIGVMFAFVRLYEIDQTSAARNVVIADHMHVVKRTETLTAVKCSCILQKCVFLGKVGRGQQCLVASQLNVYEEH